MLVLVGVHTHAPLISFAVPFFQSSFRCNTDGSIVVDEAVDTEAVSCAEQASQLSYILGSCSSSTTLHVGCEPVSGSICGTGPSDFRWDYHPPSMEFNETFYSGTIVFGDSTFMVGGESFTTRAFGQAGSPLSIPGPTLRFEAGSKYVLSFHNLLNYEPPASHINSFKVRTCLIYYICWLAVDAQFGRPSFSVTSPYVLLHSICVCTFLELGSKHWQHTHTWVTHIGRVAV
jgi:hypothetical protein